MKTILVAEKEDQIRLADGELMELRPGVYFQFEVLRRKQRVLEVTPLLPAPTVECPQCQQAFKNQHGLSMHIAKIHRGAKKLANGTCPECGFMATNAGGLMTHRINKHGLKHQPKRLKSGPFACEHCPRTFPTMLGLRRHRTFVHKGGHK